MTDKISSKVIKSAKSVGKNSAEIGSTIFSGLAKPLEEKFRKFVREKAFERARATIALSPKNIEELSEEDIEVIVAAEESKIIQEIQGKSLLGALAALGFSILGGG
tara:strand:- start:137 stop:454 length:318 start_codon:yes stop_codon:yes gene_type:complete